MAERKLLYINDYAIPEEAHPDNDSTTFGQLTIASGPVLSGSGIDMNDKPLSEIDSLSFNDINGQIAGIENQNLLDKSAAETITGAYTYNNNIAFDNVSRTIAGIENGNLLDKSAAETITGAYTYNNNIAFDNVSRTIAGIENGNLLDKSAAESIAGLWTFNTSLPQSSLTPSNANDLTNKTYVDNLVQGVDVKNSVKVGTTGYIDLIGTQTLDNIALSVDDRVLAKDQGDGRKEVSIIDTVADVSDSLDGTWFTIYDDSGSVAVWIDVDDSGTTEPTHGKARSIEVTTITTDMSANDVATQIQLALNGDSKFVATVSTNRVTVTDASIGVRDDISDNNTGFTFNAVNHIEGAAAAAEKNGIYLCKSGSWVRTADTNTWDELVSAFVFVEEGTTQADTGWVCTVNSGGTLETTAVVWAQFSGAGSYLAGDGLDLTGNVFSVDVTDIIDTNYGLTENANNVRIKLESDGAIDFDSSNHGLEVQVDDDTIGISSNALYVKTNSIGVTEIDETENYTWTGIHDFSGGDIVLPNNATASPVEGNIYWNDSNNTLKVYDADASEWKTIQEQGTIVMTAGEALLEREFVYVSAANTVMKSIATNVNCVKTIGCSDEAIANTASGDIKISNLKTGFSGLTAGSVYYISNTTAGSIQSTIPTSNGNFIIRVGIAINTTDILLGIKFLGRRRAA